MTHPVQEYFQTMNGLLASAKGVSADKVDTAYSWLLEHGEAFEGGRVLDSLPKGTPKQCFQNTFVRAEDTDVFPEDAWAYTEGYAMRESLGIALSHAWLSNGAGEVYETTWESEPDEKVFYWGVPFRLDFVRQQMLAHGYWGILFPGEMFNTNLLQTMPEQFRAWPKGERTFVPALSSQA